MSILDPKPLTVTSGNAIYAGKADVVPKWKATTAYTAGQQVISPDGDVVAAVADFTSGATFNAANWKYVRFSDYFVNARSYGAHPSNLANHTVAIQAALDAAAANPVAGQAGGVCYLPPGTYFISAQLVIPHGVRFIGASAVGTKIQATGGFPANTAMVRLGKATDTTAIFATTIETIRLWHNGTAGSVGVYSSEANELCGVYDVSIGNFTGDGILFERIGAQDPPANVTIERVYLTPASAGASTGIKIGCISGEGLIRNVTIDGFDPGMTQTGILVQRAGSMTLIGIHPESCVNGIDVGGDASSAGTIIGVSGHDSNTTLVRLRATGGATWTATGVTKSGTNVTLIDEYNDVTLNDSQIPFYSQSVGATPAKLRDATAFQLTGESSTQVATISRLGSQGIGATASGDLLLTYFTPLKPVLVSKLAAGSSAAVTGATLVRMSLYTVAADGALTLVAATANDTTVFAAANTVYERALSTGGGLPATYRLLPGVQYAMGFLIVATGMGALIGQSLVAALATSTPRLTARLTGQADLPTSATAASLSINESRMVWGRCAV